MSLFSGILGLGGGGQDFILQIWRDHNSTYNNIPPWKIGLHIFLAPGQHTFYAEGNVDTISWH